jgi:transcriptional regulator with XRE-family HTH domain
MISGIRIERKSNSLTQRQLADKVGVNVNSVRAWENGLNNPTEEHLKKIAEVLECSVDDLLKEG